MEVFQAPPPCSPAHCSRYGVLHMTQAETMRLDRESSLLVPGFITQLHADDLAQFVSEVVIGDVCGNGRRHVS
jgi:hypothetical protein